MLENSVCYKIWRGAVKRLSLYYYESVLCLLVAGIYRFFLRISEKSTVRHILTDDLGFENALRYSVCGRINRLFAKFTMIQDNTRESVRNSRILGLIAGLLDLLPHLSVRAYGLFFMSLGAGLYGLSFIRLDDFFPNLVLFGLIGVGAILFVINRSFWRLWLGSGVMKAVLGFFITDEPSEKEIKITKYMTALVYFLFTALGFLCAVGSLFGLLGLLAPVGVLGGLMVLRRTSAGIYLLVFTIPLLPTKYILALCVLTLLSFGLGLLLGNHRIKISLVDLFAAIFLLLVCVSVGFSYIPRASAVTASTYVLFILMYFVVKNVITDRKQIYSIVSLLLASALLVSLYGIYQRFSGSFVMTDAWLDTEMFENVARRVYSTLDNPNVLGEYLIFAVALAFSGLYFYKKPLYKCVSLGILGLSCLAMIFTMSRGAWLGLIAAMALFVLVYDRRLLWLGVVALVILPFALPPEIIERFTSIGNTADTSTAYRVNIWMASVDMLKLFWPAGIGPSTEVFMSIYQKFAYNTVYAPHSHNLFLQLVIDFGLTGFLTFAMMMVSFFKGLILDTKKRIGLMAPAAALFGGMGGYLIQGLTDNVWYNYRVVLFFWVIVAVSGLFDKLRQGELN